ncbi:hypothetical protein OIDMADRAFT_137757 [Oidiodendron maius Zn]|uniref:Aldehyde dehydrogenase domain-containing protein n=1 Tax=Oidiodendron maius (strain Zn) TaxID=913774 RepID=A0A0C3GB64_OIDMZ|nr:hypothetical protein OIDMADRAFT_137757 [Oidiodendron maius Zn]
MLKTVLLRNQSVTNFRYCHGYRTFRSFLSTATSAQPLKGQIPLIINGKDVVTKASFPLVGPLKNEEVWTVSSASIQDAADAANAAQSAFTSWSRTKPSYRRDIFLRAADVMAKRKDELGEYMRQEIGADEGYQQFILGLAIEGLKDTAGRIAGACAGSLPDSIHDGMRAMVQKRPYGVVLGIAPWNAPYHLGLRSITFPLAVGNTAILKGSELTPCCYWAIADVFREAGLPDGVLNFIVHRPADAVPVTNSLIAHPAVRKINFTGSSKVGAILAAEAGRHLKPTLMELGGKANAIVLKDANLENAAKHCADLFRETVDKMFGSVNTTPILVNSGSARRNRSLIEDAKSKGAKSMDLFSEVIRTDVETHMRPVVLTNVDKTMDLYGGESFGPSVSLYAFETEDEVVALANDTDYGLTASVYSEDLKAAFRVADRLDTGAVHINSMTVHDEFALPHGGVKSSGFGRFNGYQGLEEFLYCKSVTWME